MTHKEIKAALLTKQEISCVDADSISLEKIKSELWLLDFTCKSYRSYWLGDIAKHYAVEVHYVDAFSNERILVGLILTPKADTQ